MYDPDPNKLQNRPASSAAQARPASPGMVERNRTSGTGATIIGLIVVLAVIFLGYMILASGKDQPAAPPVTDQSVTVPAPAEPNVAPPATTPAPDQSMAPAPAPTDQTPADQAPADQAPTDLSPTAPAPAPVQ